MTKWNGIERSALKPRTTPLARTRKRKPSEFARIYGSKARVEWIASQPCVVCGDGPCENAHTESGGMGRKGGYESIVPLCGPNPFSSSQRYAEGHHGQLHRRGRQSFEAFFGVDLDECAERTARAWLAREAVA